MPKDYTKNTWQDEELADEALYNILEDDDTPYKSDVKIVLSTDVIQAGTALTATKMNNLENGVDTLDTKLADASDLLTSGGTSTAYTITTIGAAALRTGEAFRVKFHATAGASPTLNRDSKGAKALKYYDETGTKQACTAAQIIANVILTVLYDGTDYVLLGGAGGGGGAWGDITGTLSDQTDLNDALNARLTKDADNQIAIGTQYTVADDAATSFTPITTAGLILIQSRSASATNYLFSFYVITAGGSFSPTYAIGSNTVVTTGALTGTTGTDGKLTLSVNTSDGKIYIENRTGASRNIMVKIW